MSGSIQKGFMAEDSDGVSMLSSIEGSSGKEAVSSPCPASEFSAGGSAGGVSVSWGGKSGGVAVSLPAGGGVSSRGASAKVCGRAGSG